MISASTAAPRREGTETDDEPEELEPAPATEPGTDPPPPGDDEDDYAGPPVDDPDDKG